MFLKFCHWMSEHGHEQRVARWRWRLLNGVLARFVREHRYGVGNVPGYAGWLELPLLGTLAFRKTDGSIQYEW